MALGWRKNYFRYKSYFLNIVNIYKQRKDLKMFLEVILSLITIAFFAIFALRPTLLTIAELVKDIEAKKQTVSKMDTKISNLQKAQDIMIQEEAKISLLRTAIPDKPSPEIFVRQIEGLVAKHSVNILGMSIGEAVLVGEEKVQRKKTEVTELPLGAGSLSFSVSVTGNYQSIISFLSDLENLRMPVKIDAVNIVSSNDEEGAGLVLVATGRIPYLKKQ